MTSGPAPHGNPRARLLAGLPMTQQRLTLNGVSTAVLEGGEGPPLVLLHGPGEFAASWLTVLPALLRTHRVIVPDLPGHGESSLAGDPLGMEGVLGWVGELIEQTCPTPPLLVGRIVGGAIGARYALAHKDRLRALVLVDTTGLTAFQPDPRFGLALHRFFGAPTQNSYDRLMDLCTYDLDSVRARLGDRWPAFQQYAVEVAGRPAVIAAAASLIDLFGGQIPPADLARIGVPTTLIWGRHDLATPLQVARSASELYGWPLEVIEDAGDDPALEQPAAFVRAVTARVPVS